MSLTPRIGNWYESPDSGNFEVVAYEPDDGIIEVQFYDGTVEEYDLETWDDLHLQPAAAPEDWSGSLDIRGDDYGVDLDKPAGEFTENPLDYLD